MSQADQIYNQLVQDILDNGLWDTDQDVRTKWDDGESAYSKSVMNPSLLFENQEVPILTTKKVAWKTAIRELLWIWRDKDNNVDNLEKQGVGIWSKWKREDGTIGKAYGYQLGKKCREVNGTLVDQVDYLLHTLRHNPSSRRIMTTLWDIQDLDDMALQPCVWSTHWMVKGSKLHLSVKIRSNDILVGGPFNYFQYYVLQRMVAQVTGIEIGNIHFHIDDAHLYDRHIESAEEQLSLPEYPAPTLWLNPEIKNFYDFTIDDFQLIDYQHGPTLRLEVAE
ncbi:thymidylate synthase [Croceifilum oryzae]|uniref:Thymidylate synthase n=1 Tax=Croceifilum oryzae TaxID=1553429 RepID=A0AAJ1TF06_9BACL|nr:thymidylate synthase [Croceifilum oryzae]MDQ0417204.1 thymidylate synthase [Croceifilum oryzae]